MNVRNTGNRKRSVGSIEAIPFQYCSFFSWAASNCFCAAYSWAWNSVPNICYSKKKEEEKKRGGVAPGVCSVFRLLSFKLMSDEVLGRGGLQRSLMLLPRRFHPSWKRKSHFNHKVCLSFSTGGVLLENVGE